jgi:hypothetical protein
MVYCFQVLMMTRRPKGNRDDDHPTAAEIDISDPSPTVERATAEIKRK